MQGLLGADQGLLTSREGLLVWTKDARDPPQRPPAALVALAEILAPDRDPSASLSPAVASLLGRLPVSDALAPGFGGAPILPASHQVPAEQARD